MAYVAQESITSVPSHRGPTPNKSPCMSKKKAGIGADCKPVWSPYRKQNEDRVAVSMYILLEYFAVLTLVAMAATGAFGVISIILVIREGLGWLAVASRQLFLQEGDVSFGRRQSGSKAEVFGQVTRHDAPRCQRPSVESITIIARPAA